MNRNLLILGAGQYGAVVKEIAESMARFDKISFLDDNFIGDDLNCHQASIGKISDLEKFSHAYTYAIPAIGNPEVRMELIKKINEIKTYKVPVIVSPRAYVSPSAQIQSGAVIEPLAGVHANAIVGTASFISMGAVVNHNAVVSEGCHIDNNAVVMAGAIVRAKTKVESCNTLCRGVFNV